jgi:hypothetical protein
LDGKHKSKQKAYAHAKRIVKKEVSHVSGDPAKAAFFGKHRYEARVEYDKDKKHYKVYKHKMW